MPGSREGCEVILWNILTDNCRGTSTLSSYFMCSQTYVELWTKLNLIRTVFTKHMKLRFFNFFFLISMKVLFNTLTFKRLNLTNESLCHISDWINCVSNVVQHHWQVQGSGQEIIRGNLPSNIFISPRINAENSERWLIMILRLIVQIPSHSSKSPNR